MSGSTSAASPVASGSTNQQQSQQIFSIHAVLDEITRSQDDVQLAQYLRNCGTKDTRELAYASLLDDGRDPLDILDVSNNTLGFLYLLSARLALGNAAAPPIPSIQNFCENFDPAKARLAPERVTLLGKAIVAFFEASNALADSIAPLSTLVSRYPPSPSHLTTLHPLLARVCAATRQYAALLPALATPITEVDLAVSDLHYNDNLVYHYAAGLALAVLGRWGAAEECFEAVVGAPTQVPAAIQLEALKKLALVQLITYGKVKDIMKHINVTLVSHFKKTPYAAFVHGYPLKQAQLEQIIEKEAETFASDKNTGLVQLALGRARRWAIKGLTLTYISLSLSEIGNAVGLADEQAVRTTVQSMIDEHEIVASISDDGSDTVIFGEDAASSAGAVLTPAQIGELLAAAQAQSALLGTLDRQMERSKEFVGKAWKGRHGDNAYPGGLMGAPDEDITMKGAGVDAWVEEI